METKQMAVPMGAIMCSLCDELIDTFESEKVIIYYSNCNNKNCGEQDGVEENES